MAKMSGLGRPPVYLILGDVTDLSSEEKRTLDTCVRIPDIGYSVLGIASNAE